MTSRRLMIHPMGTDKAVNTKRWGHVPAMSHVCIGSFSTESSNSTDELMSASTPKATKIAGDAICREGPTTEVAV
jgi:hypothetical protein